MFIENVRQIRIIVGDFQPQGQNVLNQKMWVIVLVFMSRFPCSGNLKWISWFRVGWFCYRRFGARMSFSEQSYARRLILVNNIVKTSNDINFMF
jgi:hypothetical protein